MGYKKYATKGEMLEANRDYLIEEFNGKNGEPRSVKVLADEFKVDRRTMERKFAKWREKGLVEYRHRGRLESDKENIIALYTAEPKIPLEEIAEKFTCSRSMIVHFLKLWGVYKPEPKSIYMNDALPKISLNDLKTCWPDIFEETIITVGRIPKFRLIPIGKED